MWQKLHEILLPAKEDTGFRSALGNLHTWLCLVDTIDDQVCHWLKTSVDCLDHSWDAHLLVEYLATHVDKSSAKVGEIYLYMLGKDLYPDYEKEHIRSIIRALYQNALKEQADRICNLYLAKGYDFLRDLWEENQTDERKE